MLAKRNTFDDSSGRVLLDQIAATSTVKKNNATRREHKKAESPGQHRMERRKSNHGGCEDDAYDTHDDESERDTSIAIECSRSFDDVRDGRYYLCFAAAAALITFCESENTILSGTALSVRFVDPEHFCVIDNTAIDGLNLVHQKGSGSNRKDAGAMPSLFSLLSAGLRTNGGKRLLRQNIVQPPRDIVTIAARLDAVGELVANEALFLDAAKLVGSMPVDLEKAIYSAFAMSQSFSSSPFPFASSTTLRAHGTEKLAATIRNLLRLKDALQLVAQVAPCLINVDSRLLATIRDICANPNFTELGESIARTLDPQISAENRSLNNRGTYVRGSADRMLTRSISR